MHSLTSMSPPSESVDRTGGSASPWDRNALVALVAASFAVPPPELVSPTRRGCVCASGCDVPCACVFWSDFHRGRAGVRPRPYDGCACLSARRRTVVTICRRRSRGAPPGLRYRIDCGRSGQACTLSRCEGRRRYRPVPDPAFGVGASNGGAAIDAAAGCAVAVNDAESPLAWLAGARAWPADRGGPVSGRQTVAFGLHICATDAADDGGLGVAAGRG